jgi:hypothetical protein
MKRPPRQIEPPGPRLIIGRQVECSCNSGMAINELGTKYSHYLLARGILQVALGIGPVRGEVWSFHEFPSWDSLAIRTSQHQASSSINGFEDG